MPSNTLKLKDDGRNILQEGDSITVTEKDNKYRIKIDTKDMHIQVFKKPWFSSSPTKEVLEVVIDSDKNKIKYNSSAFPGERNIEGYKNLSLNTLNDARKVLTEVIENLKTENYKMFQDHLDTMTMNLGLASPYLPPQLQYVPQYGEELDTLDHVLKLLRE